MAGPWETAGESPDSVRLAASALGAAGGTVARAAGSPTAGLARIAADASVAASVSAAAQRGSMVRKGQPPPLDNGFETGDAPFEFDPDPS